MPRADRPARSSSDDPTLEGVVAAFEACWRRGEPPAIDPYLPPGGPARRPLLVELVHVDLEWRLKSGEAVRVEDYLGRYPELAEEPSVAASLAAAEYEIRRRREPGLDPAEFLRRFPRHARPPDATTLPEPPGQSDSLGAAAPPPDEKFDLSEYEILGELGRGGMGVVYRALDRRRGREVALKTLPRLDPSGLYRFKQEFRALAGVSHPNLVTLHEMAAEGPTWFFTMEYIDGVDFMRHVRTDAGRLRGALRQLASGLSALHAAGRLHRDVKPSNVLVEASGRVVLLDFGLAAELDAAGLHRSTERHLLGTAAYMAPEQAAGLAVSPAADWYSVGAMLYEALTGRLPFAGDFHRTIRDKQERDPPPPHELAADIPEDLDRLCVELLRRDSAARPTGPEVLRRLGASPPDAAAAPRARPPFVGRDALLQALADAFEAVRRGRTVVVSVNGPSGAGKTALVQHFLDGVAEGGAATVLPGRCYEQESVPYKALDSLIDALARFLGRLPAADAQAVLPRDVRPLVRVFPVLGRVEAVARAPAGPAESADPHEARRRATAALRELLARLGDRRPLLLFIDDLQWGDVDGAALLADLLRPPQPPVLLLVGAYRSEDAADSPFLRGYLGPGGAAAAASDRRDLEVAPLAPAEARDLALTLLGRADADSRARAEAVARESGGSPFFVYELVQHLLGADGPSGDAALDEVLWARIGRLSAEARRLLEAAAVAGRPLRLADACRAAGVEADAALAPLRAGRLLRAQHERIDAYHDRVRETVLAHLAPAELADCHRRLAGALEAGGAADAEVLAVHFHGAGMAEPAGRYYAAAADQAAEALAFDHAARLYRLALQLSPAEWALRAKLADALANAGRGAEAAREYLAAAAGPSTAESLELQRRAALQFLVSGHIDEGIRTLRPVLDAVGMRLASTPLRALASLLMSRTHLWLRGVAFRERTADQATPEDLKRIDVCWSVTIGLICIDTIRGAAFQSHGLLLALRAGEPIRIVRALAIEAGHVSTAGWWAKPRAMKLLKVARELARRLDHPHALGLVTFIEGVVAYVEGSWKRGLEFCDRAERIFRDRCVGVAWELDTARSFALWCLNFMGEAAELTRRWHEAVQDARQRGDLYALTNLRTFNMSLVRLAADEPEEARRDVREAIGQWSQEGYHIQHHNALLARVPIEMYTSHPVAAWEQVSKNWRRFWNSLLGLVQFFRITMRQMRAYSGLAVAAVAPAERKALLRVAERDARSLRRERMPWPTAHACYIRAAVAYLRGDAASARKGLAEAASAFESADMRLYAAATRRRLGRLLSGAEGDALIAAADAWMVGQGVRNPARMTAVFAPGFPDG